MKGENLFEWMIKQITILSAYQEASVFRCSKVFACIKHSYLCGNWYATLCWSAFLYNYLWEDLDSQLTQSVLFPQQLMTRSLSGWGRYARGELESMDNYLFHTLLSCFLPSLFLADNFLCDMIQSHIGSLNCHLSSMAFLINFPLWNISF